MVSVSGPISTGILAGRLSGSPGSRQNGDAEGEKDLKAAERARIRHESDLYVRPSWTDAAIALDQLEKLDTASCGPSVRGEITALTQYWSSRYLRSAINEAHFDDRKYILTAVSATRLLSPSSLAKLCLESGIIDDASTVCCRCYKIILLESNEPLQTTLPIIKFVIKSQEWNIKILIVNDLTGSIRRSDDFSLVATADPRRSPTTLKFVRIKWTLNSYFSHMAYGKADGQRSAVWFRARLQDQLSQLGYFLQRHAGKVLFVAVLALAILCVALKSAQVNSKVEQLWVQDTYRKIKIQMKKYILRRNKDKCMNFYFVH
ncbi:Protein patched [Cyphomyrmex costatus]|uniref:Protein patched n=1 Tax=Cyphomyrmex costatus TaxID=456900 RepID=A0A151IQX1_9HYME|nr:Protein patched [Cyphomyrmex costatus]